MKKRPRMRSRGAAGLLAASCLIGNLATSTAGAQGNPTATNGTVTEEKVKAAFVVRFLNYVEWPPASFPQADSPYVIGVIGAPDLARELDKSAALTVPGRRPIVIRRIGERDSVSGAHVIFIGNIDRTSVNRWLGLAAQEAALLITEVDSALPRGSMINFRLVEDRVRFEVALEPVDRAGLKLNSRLLTVAMTVTKGPAS